MRDLTQRSRENFIVTLTVFISTSRYFYRNHEGFLEEKMLMPIYKQ